MLSFKWFVSAALTLSTASAVNFARVDSLIRANVLKRDDLSPGSPLYNCHDNCGEALLEGQNCPSVCSDTTFLTDYDNCLQCSGPDNADIWQWYGPDLTDYASACGLSTSPLNGTQANVTAAIAASNSTSACAAATSASAASSSSAASSATATSSGAASTASASSSSNIVAANVAAYAGILLSVVGMVGF
ncbi:unnamed protein product [Discula destructiva]